MPASAYRFQREVVVVFRCLGGYKLRSLPPGTIFVQSVPRPDSSGMIDGVCNGQAALIFARDLEERAQPLLAEAAKPPGNVIPIREDIAS